MHPRNHQTQSKGSTGVSPSQLCSHEADDNFIHDGNGNVMGLVAASDGTLSARYACGPFGEPLRATGPQAANPFRFSSKYCDAGSGLYYYEHRHYDSVTGKWLNADPLGERGGMNLYAFVGNAPISLSDFLGLADCCGKSYLVLENATGLFGEWLESDTEKAGTKLGLTEGFENKWAEKHELLKTLRTAERDDIVVFFGHSYVRASGKTEGVVANSDWPFYEFLGGDPVSAKTMIQEINKVKGAPSLLMFMGCRSKDFGADIAKSTETGAVIGTTKTLGLGVARELLKAFYRRLDKRKSIRQIVNEVNSARAESNAKLEVLGGKDLDTPLGELLNPKK